MNLKEIQVLFDAGAISGCEIHKAPMSNNWHLVFIRKIDKQSIPLTTQRDSDQPRIFKTLDSAFAVAFDVGCQTITIRGG